MLIETIEDEGGLARLSAEWDTLLSASRKDGPFLRHSWLQTWWRLFGADSELNVVTCRGRAGGELLGVLPLYVKRSGRLLAARTGRFLGDEGAGSVGMTAFARQDVEEPVLDRFASHLRESRLDVLDLLRMDADDPLLQRLQANGDRSRCESPEGYVCRWMRLPEDWDGYERALPRKQRRTMQLMRRKVQDRGIEVELVRDVRRVPSAIEDLVRLHDGRMRSRYGAAFVSPDSHTRFLERTLRSLSAEDRLRLMFLHLDGRRLAVEVMFRYRDSMYSMLAGFDEEWASLGVGSTLQSHAIGQAIEEGCAVLDMLLGDQRYKVRAGARETRRLADLHVYHASPAGQARRWQDAVARKVLRPIADAPRPAPRTREHTRRG